MQLSMREGMIIPNYDKSIARGIAMIASMVAEIGMVPRYLYHWWGKFPAIHCGNFSNPLLHCKRAGASSVGTTITYSL